MLAAAAVLIAGFVFVRSNWLGGFAGQDSASVEEDGFDAADQVADVRNGLSFRRPTARNSVTAIQAQEGAPLEVGAGDKDGSAQLKDTSGDEVAGTESGSGSSAAGSGGAASRGSRSIALALCALILLASWATIGWIGPATPRDTLVVGAVIGLVAWVRLLLKKPAQRT